MGYENIIESSSFAGYLEKNGVGVVSCFDANLGVVFGIIHLLTI